MVLQFKKTLVGGLNIFAAIDFGTSGTETCDGYSRMARDHASGPTRISHTNINKTLDLAQYQEKNTRTPGKTGP